MYSFKNILIPTDFSPAAWNAIQLGVGLGTAEVSEMTLLHVFPHAAKFNNRLTEFEASDIKTIESLKKQMDEFCNELQSSNKIKINSVVIGGTVDDEILRFIEHHRFDLIIMGVNSSGLDNQPGSHLATIIEKSNVPVLVVPNSNLSEKLSA